LAGAAIRPPAPFFSPSSRGRTSFGVGKPKNCSGYVGLAAGFPGIYRILVRDLPGLRDYPKNCSGYCTRQELGKQPGIFRLEIPPAWEQTEQLFGILDEDQVEITWASASPASPLPAGFPVAWGINRTIVRVMPRRRYWCFFINFFIFSVDI